MSYDVYILPGNANKGPCPTCGHNAREDGRLFEVGNMTSNVSGMWYRAMPYRKGMPNDYGAQGNPKPEEERGGIAGLSGMVCEDALPILNEGVRYMEENADELRKLEPDNGWGDYPGALWFLRRLRDAAAEHPRGIIAASW